VGPFGAHLRVDERALEPSLAHAAHRLQRVLVNWSSPRMSVPPARVLHFHLLPYVPCDAARDAWKWTGRTRAPCRREAFAHVRWPTPANPDADRRTAVVRIPIRVFPITATTRTTGGLRLLDYAHGFTAELGLLKVHELRHESDIWGDALAPLEDEGVGTGQRPVVCVDEVCHHGGHGA
jgi:hypothetical protein